MTLIFVSRVAAVCFLDMQLHKTWDAALRRAALLVYNTLNPSSLALESFVCWGIPCDLEPPDEHTLSWCTMYCSTVDGRRS